MRDKTIAIIMISIEMLLLTSGCGNKTDDKELLQNYLRERYGEEFVVLNTEKTANGYTPFSYKCSASCIPKAAPDRLFKASVEYKQTDEVDYFDLYGQGILNKRAADMVKEKIGDFFFEYSVRVELGSPSDIVLPDMGQITFENYFKSVEEDYPEKSDKLSPVSYYITVNADSYRPESYSEEYDLLYGVLESFSDEFRTDGRLWIRFMEDELYKRNTEWYSENVYSMPKENYYRNYDETDENSEYHYESFDMYYDFSKREIVSSGSDREPMIKDAYITIRTKKSGGLDNGSKNCQSK